MDLGLTQPGGKGGMKNPHMGQGCGRIIRERERVPASSVSPWHRLVTVVSLLGTPKDNPGHS